MEAVAAVAAGYRLPRPDACPEHMYSIMLRCWMYLPAERPDFAELFTELQHLIKTGELLTPYTAAGDDFFSAGAFGMDDQGYVAEAEAQAAMSSKPGTDASGYVEDMGSLGNSGSGGQHRNTDHNGYVEDPVGAFTEPDFDAVKPMATAAAVAARPATATATAAYVPGSALPSRSQGLPQSRSVNPYVDDPTFAATMSTGVVGQGCLARTGGHVLCQPFLSPLLSGVLACPPPSLALPPDQAPGSQRPAPSCGAPYWSRLSSSASRVPTSARWVSGSAAGIPSPAGYATRVWAATGPPPPRLHASASVPGATPWIPGSAPGCLPCLDQPAWRAAAVQPLVASDCVLLSRMHMSALLIQAHVTLTHLSLLYSTGRAIASWFQSVAARSASQCRPARCTGPRCAQSPKSKHNRSTGCKSRPSMWAADLNNILLKLGVDGLEIR